MLSVEIEPASNGIYGVCRVAEGTLTTPLLHIAFKGKGMSIALLLRATSGTYAIACASISVPPLTTYNINMSVSGGVS